MSVFSTVGAYVKHLQQAECVPRPSIETWDDLIARISIPGRIALIDEETYWYFLEVLPPKHQRAGRFVLAEAAEPLRLFWHQGDQHFCRQLTWDESCTFCRLAAIPLPS